MLTFYVVFHINHFPRRARTRTSTSEARPAAIIAMDCVIPSHSVRTFAASVACLGRVGKELYVDFDPLDGLTLRTLNDAKSAYAAFRFAPSFFERCAAPPQPSAGRRRQRPRDGRRDGAGRSGRRGSRRKERSRSRSRDKRSSDGDEDFDGDDDDERYMCRVPVRTVHAVLRPRKGVQSLRIRSVGMISPESDKGDNGGGSSTGGSGGTQETEASSSLMQLSFQFRIENPKAGGSMQVVHRVGVTDADGVAAVAPRDGRSEITAAPRVLLRMLDPLKRTAEVALTVDDVAKAVTATSFHHGDAVAAAAGASSSDGGGVGLLGAVSASILKTETSIGADEFEDYAYCDDRDEDRARSSPAEEGTCPPPQGVNEEVTLVFGIKEAKAMLQFCSQVSPDGDEMTVTLSFHWGGRPVAIEAETDSISAMLILATLDHKLLGRREGRDGGCADGQRARKRPGGSRRNSGSVAEER